MKKLLSISLSADDEQIDQYYFVELDGNKKRITRDQYNIYKYLITQLQVDIASHLQENENKKGG
jgi:hypothetical protein